MNTPNWRRALSTILCAVLTLTLFPVTAFGSDEPYAEAAASLISAEDSILSVPTVAEEGIMEETAVDTAEPLVVEVDTEVSEESVSEEEPISGVAEPADEEEPVAEVEDPVPEDGAAFAFSMTCVNPYNGDDGMDDEDCVLDGASETVIDGYCTTEEEAAAIVREQMKARNTSFVFGFCTTEYPTQDYLKKTLASIADMAMAHTGEPTEGDYLLWQYRKYYAYSDNDGYYKNGKYYLNFHYSFSYYTSATQEAAMDRVVASLLENLDVSDENDYAKLSSVYDYICDNVRYDYWSSGNLKYTAYAALVNGKAVCQGYATLLYRLALELGVDCRIIAGTADGEDHRWNIALVNGAYYNLDPTWDAGESDYYCFLVSDENLVNHTRSSVYSSTTFQSAYPVSDEDFSLDASTPSDIEWGNVSWTNADGVLTVSGSGSMPDCTSAEQTPWAEETFASVLIEDGLTSVGSNTFAGAGVTQATVPESVDFIGQDAFGGCGALTDIYIMSDDCEIFDGPNTLGDPATTIVHCYYNSTAMAYAEKYGYGYVNMGFSNCTISLEITTAVSAEEPVARIYNASATDLEMYEDVVKDESEIAEQSVVSVSDETLREDGLYSRTVLLQNVEPGKYNLAVYVPGGYVITLEFLNFTNDIKLGERHIWRYGDVDDNGTIDARDATQVYRQANDEPSVFGGTSHEYTEKMRLRAADVNMDGMYSDADAEQILYYINGLASCFEAIP